MFGRKKTSFKAGSLRIEPLRQFTRLSADSAFVPYKKIDKRYEVIWPDNQGVYPDCTGRAWAGLCEYYHWKLFGHPVQFPAHDIYLEGQRIAKSEYEGLTIEEAFEGVKSLELAKGTLKLFHDELGLQYAMHKYGICLLAFQITDEWNDVHTKTGRIAEYSDPKRLGGHLVLGCYYDEYGPGWQNSWGEGWGNGGFGQMTWEQCSKQLVYGATLEMEWVK